MKDLINIDALSLIIQFAYLMPQQTLTEAWSAWQTRRVCDIRAVRDYRAVVRRCILTWIGRQRHLHRRRYQPWRVTRVVQQYVVTAAGRQRALWAHNSAFVLSEYFSSFTTLRYENLYSPNRRCRQQ